MSGTTGKSVYRDDAYNFWWSGALWYCNLHGKSIKGTPIKVSGAGPTKHDARNDAFVTLARKHYPQT